MCNAMKGWLAGMLVTGVAMFVPGCATTPSNAGAAAGDKEQAIMCAKCQTVWVSRPRQVGVVKFITYRNEKVMECPDCRSAVMNFFTTGKWEHTCNVCGTNLMVCPLCK